MLMFLAATSFAMDDKGPATPDDWDKVILDQFGPVVDGVVYQFAPNTTEVWSPSNKSGLPSLAGHIHTATEYAEFPFGDVTESWIVFQPDATLTREMEAHYVGATPGGLTGLSNHYAQLTNADDYKLLSFDMVYLEPPTPSEIDAFPDVIPWFVDQIVEFDVTTEIDGSVKSSGSLYRQRMVFGGVVSWWDVWVLYDTYVFPEDSHVVTRLKPRNTEQETVRRFLQNLPQQGQWAMVHTHSAVRDL
ncbi:MAG: hypothetical protein H6735_14730 [Alphaproteobacteria bacterium]|nr:hypothetical protein [Alphaproteobacteria bacterium]